MLFYQNDHPYRYPSKIIVLLRSKNRFIRKIVILTAEVDDPVIVYENPFVEQHWIWSQDKALKIEFQPIKPQTKSVSYRLK